jgi:hypothetical protein
VDADANVDVDADVDMDLEAVGGEVTDVTRGKTEDEDVRVLLWPMLGLWDCGTNGL